MNRYAKASNFQAVNEANLNWNVEIQIHANFRQDYDTLVECVGKGEISYGFTHADDANGYHFVFMDGDSIRERHFNVLVGNKTLKNAGFEIFLTLWAFVQHTYMYSPSVSQEARHTSVLDFSSENVA